MISVKFTKNYANKLKGEVAEFDQQLAYSLVHKRKVATFDLIEVVKVVKPKTNK